MLASDSFDCGLRLEFILCSVPPVKHRSETVKLYWVVLNIEHCDINTDNKTCGSDDNTQTGVLEKQPASPLRSPAQNSLPGDVCGHCRKKCTPRGKLSEVIQCDFFHTWVHANCDGVSKEDYNCLLHLSNNVKNVVYYCELNHCYNHIKRLAAIHVKSSSTSDDANTSIY